VHAEVLVVLVEVWVLLLAIAVPIVVDGALGSPIADFVLTFLAATPCGLVLKA
jgi:hypothetical protein